MTVLTDETKNTPLAIITELITASRGQVERIVAAVLSSSCLAIGVEHVLDTNELINEKLRAFGADEKDCLEMLSRIRGDDTDRLQALDGLEDGAAERLRQTLLEHLVIHLVDLRIATGKLERGIEQNRNAMIERLATFAVAGLSQDGAPSIVSARVRGCLSGGSTVKGLLGKRRSSLDR